MDQVHSLNLLRSSDEDLVCARDCLGGGGGGGSFLPTGELTPPNGRLHGPYVTLKHRPIISILIASITIDNTVIINLTSTQLRFQFFIVFEGYRKCCAGCCP